MQLIVALFTLSVVLQDARAQDANLRKDNFRRTQGFADAPALTFQQVRKIIREKKIKNADDLLAALPENYRRYYTLAYDSRSLQTTLDSKLPRIILYGPDARFSMTFSGDPKSATYQTVETMEYDDRKATFTMREIEFDPSRGSKPKFTHSPGKCVACHQDPARPIWEPYPVWHGVFGSRSSDKFDRIGAGTIEESKFQEFLKSSRNQGRYAQLKTIEPGEEAKRRASRNAGVSRFNPNGAVFDPNAFLSEQFAELMARKATREIRSSSKFAEFKNLLFFLSVCSNSLSEKNKTSVGQKDGSSRVEWLPNPAYINPSVYLGKHNFTEFLDDYRQLVAQEFDERTAETRKVNPVVVADRDGVGFTNFALTNGGTEKAMWIYVLQNMGLKPSTWTMALKNGTYAFDEGGPAFFSRLAFLLFNDDPKIKSVPGLSPKPTDFRFFPSTSDTHSACLNYAKQTGFGSTVPRNENCADCSVSESASKKGSFQSSVVRRPQSKSVFLTCASCHGERSSRPIPFESEAKFKEYLRGNGTKLRDYVERKVMPPDFDLDPGARDQILNTVDRLMRGQ